MKNIQVIIPVMDVDRFKKLAKNICENSHKPSLVIIVNNSKQIISHFPFKDHGIPCVTIIPCKLLATNQAWTLGISRLLRCDYVSILNDDIEIPSCFFSHIIRNFKSQPNAGVICPYTVINRKDMYKAHRIPDDVIKMKHREGWAFTIKKKLLDEIPPIPIELTMFFGDDWYWWHTYKRGFFWYKDDEVVIFHAVGSSLRKMDEEKRAILKKNERFIWYGMKTEMIKDPKYQKY